MRKSPVEKHGQVTWIASLMKQLLEEVRAAPMGVAGRARVAAIHRRSVSKLEQQLALEVVDELKGIAPPGDEEVSEPTMGNAEHGRVSRAGRLLDNIETAQFGRQRQRQRQRQSNADVRARLAQMRGMTAEGEG